jgi:hypothetical protein
MLIKPYYFPHDHPSDVHVLCSTYMMSSLITIKVPISLLSDVTHFNKPFTSLSAMSKNTKIVEKNAEQGP